MKKRLCLLFSVLLMVLSCIPSINAHAEAGFAVDLDTGAAADTLTTYTVPTGSTKELDTYKSYGVWVPSDTKELVMPIDFDAKGVLYASVLLADGEPTTADIYLNIYSDQACTQEIIYSSYDGTASIPKKGTYYLKFSVLDSGETVTDGYTIALSTQFYNGEDRALKNKTWTAVGNSDYTKPVYYKITVPQTGSITVNNDSLYTAYVTLLNSSKKAISNEAYPSSTNDYSTVFAVTKGTYYIKVTTTSELYRLKYTFKAVTDKSGTTKAKATKLTAGKTYTGVVTAADKTGKVDWYKITLTKSQKVDITFTGSVSSGEIGIEFYGGDISGSITDSITSVNEDSSFTAQTWTSTKLPKGTYYIKVTKAENKTSGVYNLKFNK